MISRNKNCIFIHIPKTGGTSIESLIWKSKKLRSVDNLWMGFIDGFHNKYQTGGLQHLLAKQIKQEVGELVFYSCYKFTIIRNPFDKAVSQYNYLNKREDLRKYLGFNQGDSFHKYLELIQEKKHVQWEPQFNFLFDNDGKKLVDYIGRFESFNDDVMHILKEIGLDRKYFGLVKKRVPHKNKGVRKSYQQYYDSYTKKIVESIYELDLNTFNYSY